MALYERLLRRTAAGGSLPPEQRGIPQHAFVSMMAERARGRVTNQQVIDAFQFDAGEVVELQALVARFTTGGSRLTREEFEEVVYIAASRIAPYDTIAAVTARLGV